MKFLVVPLFRDTSLLSAPIISNQWLQDQASFMATYENTGPSLWKLASDLLSKFRSLTGSWHEIYYENAGPSIWKLTSDFLCECRSLHMVFGIRFSMRMQVPFPIWKIASDISFDRAGPSLCKLNPTYYYKYSLAHDLSCVTCKYSKLIRCTYLSNMTCPKSCFITHNTVSVDSLIVRLLYQHV